MKRTTVYLPEEVHRALRLRAGEIDTTISELVVQAVRGLLGRSSQPGQLAEPSPAYGETNGARAVHGEQVDQPRGLLAAVGAWEGIEGLDQLETVLTEARQKARERDVEPLDQ